MNYLNEYDPHAAAWLAALRDEGLIPPCEIDTRSIEDVTPNDLRGYTQCHFFAGIAGWPLALQLAGWPADRRVWTGSCPCQPFSAAGKGAGFADERHLWPAFHWLIEQCRPPVVFGEQVASRDGLNWLDLVCADLEGAAYAVGAADLCAAGVGAPHIRQRLYWVADASGERSSSGPRIARALDGSEQPERPSGTDWLANANGSTGQQRGADIRGRSTGSDAQSRAGLGRSSVLGGLADTRRSGGGAQEQAASVGQPEANRSADKHSGHSVSPMHADPLHGFWAGADWLGCRDGKLRPVESGSFPLAHGIPARVAALRGYGNAIVPDVAAQFIKAVM